MLPASVVDEDHIAPSGFDHKFAVDAVLPSVSFEIRSANQNLTYLVVIFFVEHPAHRMCEAFARWVFESDIARGLDFCRRLKILLNCHTDWDAFVENILLRLSTGVFIGLRFQPLVFVEGDAVGGNCVDTVVSVNIITDLLGN